MSKPDNRPPKGHGFVWFTDEMLASEAFDEVGSYEFRVLRFLCRELIAHGGQANGKLRAPHRQLVECGIHPGSVTKAIAKVEAVGLIDCTRGGMRVATTYSLTWLPLHDGTPATNRWREFKKQKSASQNVGSAASQNVGRWAKSASQNVGRSAPKSASQNVGALKRTSYQGGAASTDGAVADDEAAA